MRLAIYQCEAKPVKFAAFQIGNAFLMVFLTIISIAVLDMGAEGRMLSQALACFFIGLMAFYSLFKSGYIGRGVRVEMLSKVIRFGLPIIPHAMAGLAIVAADRYILNMFEGVVAVGIYMAALQVAQGVALVSESFNKAYAPWLMKSLSGDVSKKSLVLMSYLLMTAILCLSALYGVLARYAGHQLLGSDYYDSLKFIPALSLGFGLVGCYYIVVNYLFFSERTALVMFSTLSGAFVGVISMIYLLGSFGFDAAAYAFLLANLTCFLVACFTSAKVYPMPWLSFWRGN